MGWQKRINIIKGNDMIDFIHRNEGALNKKVSCTYVICGYRLLKTDKFQMWLTVEGDQEKTFYRKIWTIV